MKALKLQYIEDKLGKKVAVILPVDDYKNMLKRLEELEDTIKDMSEEFDIPEAHQKLVNERFKKARKDPDRLLDWDKAKEKLKA
ncbi:MAG: hypothetical protein U9N72_07745 [Bacteroidota bacterium]|nr:hypothetical protein [Bacteroidota bacterium]